MQRGPRNVERGPRNVERRPRNVEEGPITVDRGPRKGLRQLPRGPALDRLLQLQHAPCVEEDAHAANLHQREVCVEEVRSRSYIQSDNPGASIWPSNGLSNANSAMNVK